jgi:hypothetical protein
MAHSPTLACVSHSVEWLAKSGAAIALVLGFYVGTLGSDVLGGHQQIGARC